MDFKDRFRGGGGGGGRGRHLLKDSLTWEPGEKIVQCSRKLRVIFCVRSLSQGLLPL